MAKVTSKLQVTIPKTLAARFGIEPGDDIDWIDAGEAIRIRLRAEEPMKAVDLETRLALFDAGTERQREREEETPRPATEPTERGWTREELYDRPRTR
jgi:AbrB family looped-hinge helix DNA binding protein